MQGNPPWIGNFIPTRTPTPFVSPLPFPEAPGACSVTMVSPAATLPVLGYVAIGCILLALALVIWSSLRIAQRADQQRRAALEEDDRNDFKE
jgi:small neutral amino acid transporter SnatA (MarC family)